jgi:hypothetical protein
MEHKGDIEEHGPSEVFEYVASRRADGVIYFRDAEGLSAYVTVKDGLPYHCGGSFGEGDAAALAVAAIERGSYNYVEDIRTDEAIFPRNITPELAEVLVSGDTAAASELVGMLEGSTNGPAPAREPATPTEKSPGPSILPAGRQVDPAEYVAEDAVDVLSKLAGLGSSGLLIVGKDGARIGFFSVKGGEMSSGRIETGGKTFIGDEAVDNVPAGCEYRFYELPEGLITLYDGAARGATMVVRMDSAAVNPEEFIAWATETGKSCIIATAGRAGSANILIADGEVVGAVTALSPEVHREIDDALAIFYAIDSEAEIYG